MLVNSTSVSLCAPCIITLWICNMHSKLVDVQFTIIFYQVVQYLHDIISTKRYYAFMQYALRVSGWGSSPAIVEPGYDNSTK